MAAILFLVIALFVCPSQCQAESYIWEDWTQASPGVRVRKRTLQLQQPLAVTCNRRQQDCSEVYSSGERGKGVYEIQPQGSTPFQVYCDDDWTVFMRRFDGTQYFYKNWNEYKEGFGSVSGEHWLGNDHLYYLTKQKNYAMRMEYTLWDSKESYYAQYSTFLIESESSNYTLTVSGYSGTDRDSWSYHNGSQFSTRDRDNDRYHGAPCAQSDKGGHWYKACALVNPTGLYKRGNGDDSFRLLTNKGWLSASKMTLKIKAL